MKHISPLVDDLVEAFRCLPGVGPKSAKRMVLYLLENHREEGKNLAKSLIETLEKVGQCEQCRIFSEKNICNICEDQKRDE